MAVVVFDADVLIGFLNKDDSHHLVAIEKVRNARAPGRTRCLTAVNYTEILIGPLLKAGQTGVARVDHVLAQLGIEVVSADSSLSREAATIRAQEGLKLPGAYAVAMALRARIDDRTVQLESFDKQVLSIFARLN